MCKIYKMSKMRYLELYLVAVLCVSPCLFGRVFMFYFFIQNLRFSIMLYVFWKRMEVIYVADDTVQF